MKIEKLSFNHVIGGVVFLSLALMFSGVIGASVLKFDVRSAVDNFINPLHQEA